MTSIKTTLLDTNNSPTKEETTPLLFLSGGSVISKETNTHLFFIRNLSEGAVYSKTYLRDYNKYHYTKKFEALWGKCDAYLSLLNSFEKLLKGMTKGKGTLSIKLLWANGILPHRTLACLIFCMQGKAYNEMVTADVTLLSTLIKDLGYNKVTLEVINYKNHRDLKRLEELILT